MDYLKGKTAVITGVSKGIGRAIAQNLLDHGVSVIGWGLHVPAYAHESLYFVECDVSEEASVKNALETSLDISPRIDFLINNAGFGYFEAIEAFEVEKFRRMLDVNLTGAFLVTKAVVPTMKTQGSGHIVNISSIAGRVGAPHGSGYNASKFALTGFTEVLFQELRAHGIKVTTVYPGSTETNFFDDIPGFSAHDRMVHPRELAETVVHLMNTSPNYLVREIEIRPLWTKKK
jgi:NAD(P)-dependent dehydrogenase (short-subunit alcohol dehydrogenase family)